MSVNQTLAPLKAGTRIWAVGAIHGEWEKLKALHAAIFERLLPNDQVVYLGDYMGHGLMVRETIDELLLFRRAFIARPDTDLDDILFLRGAQEEMFQKLLQLQFAPAPRDILTFMAERGVSASVQAYNASLSEGFSYAREGATAITRWTSQIRAFARSLDGHMPFFAALRHAALCETRKMLFVNAGVSPDLPLGEQRDLFWWGHSAFDDDDGVHPDFAMVVRGKSRKEPGFQIGEHTICLDGGAGRGGVILAALFDETGQIVTSLES